MYFMLARKHMTSGPAKHSKTARTGLLSNVLRIVGAQSAEQSVGIRGKIFFDPDIII